jgi:stage II sporulation protein GA (sporulation sigma-E factor processing peptidase)
MYVYADVVLAINIAMNSLILILTAWSAGISYKLWRIIAAASAGSLYVIWGLIAWNTAFYTPFAKFVAAAVIVNIAFKIRTVRTLLVTIACFYVISLLMGGAVIGWWYYFSQGSPLQGELFPSGSLSWKYLLAGAATVLILVLLAFRRLAANITRRSNLYTAVVTYEGRSVRFTALLDTGNELFAPAGRKPVVLVEQNVLMPILGEAVNNFLRDNSPDTWVSKIDQCPDSTWLARLQLIPYRSVGGRSLLIGFRPDCLSVVAGSKLIETDSVVIGIHSGRMASNGVYSALLHPELMQFIHRKEGANICA